MKNLIFTLVLVSCGTSDSKLSHKLGQVHRDNKKSLSQQCEQSELPATSDKNITLNQATSYLRLLLERIIEKNTAQFSSDSYNPFRAKFTKDRICVRAIDSSQINAYAVPQSGEIFVELSIIKLAKNDAQVATFLSHELAHILMGHNKTSILPDKTKDDFNHLKVAAKKLSKLCYKPAAYRFFNLENMRRVIGFDKRLEKLAFELNIYDQKRAQQIFLRNRGITDLLNCSFVKNRQQILEKMIRIGDAGIWSKDEKTKTMWVKLKAKFYKYKNDVNIQRALQEAERLLESALPDGINDLNYFYNWKEQEADEVGMELMFHSDINISQASQFWKNMMQATSFDPSHCISAIKSGKKIERGSSTHPHMCFRYYDLMFSEPSEHVVYKSKKNSHDDIFPNLLLNLKQRMSRTK